MITSVINLFIGLFGVTWIWPFITVVVYNVGARGMEYFLWSSGSPFWSIVPPTRQQVLTEGTRKEYVTLVLRDFFVTLLFGYINYGVGYLIYIYFIK